jgi:hypothetical protein
MGAARAVLIWARLAVALVAPVAIAATSPLLAWRQPVYIAAGFAGVVAMGLLLLQPLLAGGYLPGLGTRVGRLAHRRVGVALVAAVVLHVAGLWITSPPDVVDALLFRSPTPFSAWGVVAMWACDHRSDCCQRQIKQKRFQLQHRKDGHGAPDADHATRDQKGHGRSGRHAMLQQRSRQGKRSIAIDIGWAADHHRKRDGERGVVPRAQSHGQLKARHAGARNAGAGDRLECVWQLRGCRTR